MEKKKELYWAEQRVEEWINRIEKMQVTITFLSIIMFLAGVFWYGLGQVVLITVGGIYFLTMLYRTIRLNKWRNKNDRRKSK